MPYDYYDRSPQAVGDSGSSAIPANSATITAKSSASATANYVRVEAWISAKAPPRNPSVSFRVPFCGFDYQSSMPLSFSEPTVDRLGASGNDSVFRIAYPLGFERPMSVELDMLYMEGTPQLQRITNLACTFRPEYYRTDPENTDRNDCEVPVHAAAAGIERPEPGFVRYLPAEDSAGREAATESYDR